MKKNIEIKNLSELKKALEVGALFRTINHTVHPEYDGLLRVVTSTQGNCVYSKIKNKPEHYFSLSNGGLGYRTNFEKASNYVFGETVKVLKSADNKDDVLYELIVVNPSFDCGKATIRIDEDLPEGNVYAVLAKAESAMKQLSFFYEKGDIEEMQARVFNSGSYEMALRTIGEYVRITAIDKGKVIIYE